MAMENVEYEEGGGEWAHREHDHKGHFAVELAREERGGEALCGDLAAISRRVVELLLVPGRYHRKHTAERVEACSERGLRCFLDGGFLTRFEASTAGF